MDATYLVETTDEREQVVVRKTFDERRRDGLRLAVPAEISDFRVLELGYFYFGGLVRRRFNGRCNERLARGGCR